MDWCIDHFNSLHVEEDLATTRLVYFDSVPAVDELMTLLNENKISCSAKTREYFATIAE
jgi:hypothetical protein